MIRMLDLETLGLTPADGGVCEVGICDLRNSAPGVYEIDPPRSLLVNPGRPIPVEARAIHHIDDDMVRDAPDWAMARAVIEQGADVYCSHNAAFDRQFFSTDRPFICTYKVALRLWPDCPKHSNQCLRYWLGLDLDPALAMPPHRAGPDAFVTAHILKRALDEAEITDMLEWSGQPSLLPRVGFGKHYGKGWHEVPDDYLEWCLKQKDMDPDVIFTVRHHLRARVF